MELDEAYFSELRKNMPDAKRKEAAGTGRGTLVETAVVDAKDRETNAVRAKVVQKTCRASSAHGRHWRDALRR